MVLCGVGRTIGPLAYTDRAFVLCQGAGGIRSLELLPKTMRCDEFSGPGGISLRRQYRNPHRRGTGGQLPWELATSAPLRSCRATASASASPSPRRD